MVRRCLRRRFHSAMKTMFLLHQPCQNGLVEGHSGGYRIEPLRPGGLSQFNVACGVCGGYCQCANHYRTGTDSGPFGHSDSDATRLPDALLLCESGPSCRCASRGCLSSVLFFLFGFGQRSLPQLGQWVSLESSHSLQASQCFPLEPPAPPAPFSSSQMSLMATK